MVGVGQIWATVAVLIWGTRKTRSERPSASRRGGVWSRILYQIDDSKGRQEGSQKRGRREGTLFNNPLDGPTRQCARLESACLRPVGTHNTNRHTKVLGARAVLPTRPVSPQSKLTPLNLDPPEKADHMLNRDSHGAWRLPWQHTRRMLARILPAGWAARYKLGNHPKEARHFPLGALLEWPRCAMSVPG